MDFKFLMAGFIVKGILQKENAKPIVDDLVKLIDMRTEGKEPQSWDFDSPDGEHLPFTFVQPISTSFVAIETWPENEHIIVVIASCKKFSRAVVRQFLSERVGEVLDDAGCHLDPNLTKSMPMSETCFHCGRVVSEEDGIWKHHHTGLRKCNVSYLDSVALPCASVSSGSR